MTQQTLPSLERGPTFAERGPRQKLYVIPAHNYGYTRSKYARDVFSGWTVVFITDREAAEEIRKHFPLPLSLVKKLINRCKKHNWFGTVYSSWRYHPAGVQACEEEARFMLSMLRLMERI